MQLRIVTVDEVQFLTSVLHRVWGTNNPRRFKRWKLGDYVVFVVDRRVAGLAQIVAEPFVSSDPVWDNGVFPNRIRIQFVCIALPENRLSVYPRVQEVLWSANTHYGWAVFTQHEITGDAAQKIVEIVLSTPNQLEVVQQGLDRLLEEARKERGRKQASD